MHMYVIIERNFKKIYILNNLSGVTNTRKFAVSRNVDFFSFLTWMHKDKINFSRCLFVFQLYLEADGACPMNILNNTMTPMKSLLSVVQLNINDLKDVFLVQVLHVIFLTILLIQT